MEISNKVKSLIRKIFEPEATLRITAHQILQDSWLTSDSTLKQTPRGSRSILTPDSQKFRMVEKIPHSSMNVIAQESLNAEIRIDTGTDEDMQISKKRSKSSTSLIK